MHEVSNPSFDEALESIKTNSCKDLSFTADTLTVATKINPLNAHYSEELVEVSDAMIATHPECFLKAVQMTTLETQQKIREAIARINGDWSTSRGIKDLEPHLQKSEFRSLRDLWEKTESETEN